MKTILFSTCYLVGTDPTGSSRLERTKKWIQYYLSIKEELGFDHILMTDNASPLNMLKELNCPVAVRDASGGFYIQGATPHVTILRHRTHLAKTGENDHDYPYVWRGLYDTRNFFNKTPEISKIYRIDNDSYILSQRLARYFREAKSGWVGMNLHKHGNTPEDAISFICRDASAMLNDMCSVPMREHFGKQMELVTPFTHIASEFHGERYGLEDPIPEQDETMDFYSQCPVKIQMRYGRK